MEQHSALVNYENITIKRFSVIGIAIRTTNKDGQSQKDIAELWSRFIGQGLITQIPNKTGNEIYCMYTEYDSDFMGAYTTVLGCKVTSLDTIPEGFVGKEIPETVYKHYKATGALPDCVGKVWNEIWRSDIERQYNADFDLYGEKSQNLQNAEVDIFVS